MSKADLAHPELNAEPIKLTIDGKERVFDINDPKLPDWIKDNDMASGGYPYADKMDKKAYEDRLERLQIELVKLQYWLQASGHRVMSLFEGRDAAGKGGTIFVIRQYMNPRVARNVALPKPTEVERGQWYYQRYVEHFPTAGEFVTFDRSWYNRAVVEPVMGFCTPAQTEKFLGETPSFERMVVNEGIHFFKFWLNIGQEMQLKRFHDRRHDPLKIWKFSPIDIAGMGLWDDYTRRRDTMMKRTHTAHAPWTVLKTNDKRRARLAAIRHILSSLPYDGRDDGLIGEQDDRIVCAGPAIIGS
ncbi:polyphosphate kinase 2 [Nitratireductor sp. CAU 1489]|uniref:ADP/GDP-polyphosphate phosphotransferase n=1 Tax=Nitratireductor arenosus TaxID=2682096 RepID=A0A844QEY6_9HYPH|nr:polyphosphate kinase 2 [Nitratireductor arenosus]MVA98536.1 polyphosphate kinase 2 [Nitratireductor arenosus]